MKVKIPCFKDTRSFLVTDTSNITRCRIVASEGLFKFDFRDSQKVSFVSPNNKNGAEWGLNLGYSYMPLDEVIKMAEAEKFDNKVERLLNGE